MIDIDDIYKAHQEQIQREKKLKEEQERAEAERKRQEEEKRKEAEKKAAEEKKRQEELKRKATENMKEKYGNIVSEYPDLFMSLPENPLFIKYNKQRFSNHLEISNAVFEYLDKQYKGKDTHIYSVLSSKFNEKQRKLMSVHGYGRVNANNVLFFVDNSLFGGAKEGLVLTKDTLCYKNLLASPRFFNINEIKSISIRDCFISVNHSTDVECTIGIDRAEVVNILVFCICNLLILQKTNNQVSRTDVAPQVQATNTPQFEKPSGWMCQCGCINSSNKEFCCNCGTKKPGENQGWVCPQCSAKNLSTSKFCSQCGAKKPEENSKWVCTNCNAENLPKSKFCDQCGTAKP